jgi:hypothetical protein
MKSTNDKSKSQRALPMLGRIALGLLAVFGALGLADAINRGVIKGRHGAFATGRETEPALFWLLAVA